MDDTNALFVILLGIGALLLLIGLFLLIRTLGFVMRATSTEGVVIDLEETDNEGISYSSIVRFSTRDGQEITFTDSISTNPAMYSIGEQIKVSYLPDDPRKARIARPFRLFLVPMVLGAIASIFVAIGLWGL